MSEKLFDLTLKTGRKIVVYRDDDAESPCDARTRLVVPGEVYSDGEPEDVEEYAAFPVALHGEEYVIAEPDETVVGTAYYPLDSGLSIKGCESATYTDLKNLSTFIFDRVFKADLFEAEEDDPTDGVCNCYQESDLQSLALTAEEREELESRWGEICKRFEECIR